MLLWFVIIYWIISVGIGLWAALRVHNSKDYAVAGRSLPIYIVTATVFATWFGSETVLGIPATFLREGLGGVIADPFGSSMCLILVGLFFARPLYRMNLMTIGDYYRRKYGRAVEALTTICIVLSYLGWVAAQISALGLVFNVVSEGAMSQTTGMIVGASTVLVYTVWGGMWSVAITDFLQMIIIVIGMLYIGWDVSQTAGGVTIVVSHAIDAGKFSTFWPEPTLAGVLGFTAAAVTMMLGSIPQQDVFQRVASSKDERTAGRASVLGGSLYFCFAFIPMFLAYSATLIDPDLVQRLIAGDRQSQLILPNLILKHAPVFAQVMFFGALLSAIKSCASATLLAPSVSFTENILRPDLQAPGRQAAAAPHAAGGSVLHGDGDVVRAQLQPLDLQNGGECLQGDARFRIRAAGIWPVLEAGQHAGCARFDRAGTGNVDLDGTARARCRVSTAACRPVRRSRRDDHRLALAPVDPPSGRRAHASSLNPCSSAQIGVTTCHGIA